MLAKVKAFATFVFKKSLEYFFRIEKHIPKHKNAYFTNYINNAYFIDFYFYIFINLICVIIALKY